MPHRFCPASLARADLRLRAALALALVLAGMPSWAGAQAGGAPDPREARPERPSVATHAYAVAPGIVEVEAGIQRQDGGALATRLAVPLVFKIGLGRGVQLDVVPGWTRESEATGSDAGLTDVLLAVKWQLADSAPVVNDFALQTAVSLPTGSPQSGRGSGEAAINLLVISSRRIGRVSLDVNAGYTRLGGDSDYAPRDSTMWAIAAGLPIARTIAWVAEVAGYPGTAGPAGGPPVVQFLTGPTFTARPSLVLDAGIILDVENFGGTAVYAGLTWNLGRLWGASPRPSRRPMPRSLGPRE